MLAWLGALACAGLVSGAAAACTYDVTPDARNHGFGATTGAVSVATSASCAWTVENNNSWITIVSGGSGTGNGVVTYALAGNPNPAARSGVLRVAGVNGVVDFTVIQAGVNCTYSIAPMDHDKCFNTTTGTVQITTQSPCPWTVDNPNNWIQITAGDGGTGSGKLFYTVLANLDQVPRTGVVTIAGQAFTIRQNPYPTVCAPDKMVVCGEPWNFDPPALIDPTARIELKDTTTNLVSCGVFTATRTWEVVDRCESRATCTQIVVGTNAPVTVICPPDRVVGCDANWTFDEPAASSPCGFQMRMMTTVTNPICGPSFLAIRTWEISDGCTNVVCRQSIIVTATPLTTACAPNRSVLSDEAWAFEPPQSSGSCGAVTRIVNTTTNAGCGGTYTAAREWEVTDGCLTNRCSQTISVTAPLLVVVCPTNRTVRCDEAWNFGTPQVTSPGGADIRLLNTTTNAGCGLALTATRSWEISDGCVTNLCAQTINVVVPPPIITCPPDVTMTLTNGMAHCPKTLTEFRFNGGTATNGSSCDTFLRYRCSETPFMPNSNGCGGIIIRTFTLTDSCSNSASCSQTIIVLGSNVTATVTASLNDGCDVPPLALQMASPVTMTATVNASVNSPSYLTTTFSNVPPGYVVTNGGPYPGWCMDYAGEIMPNTVYQATLYRSVDALPAHLPQANWDRVNYILNHKQGTSIDIQTAIWHFIGGPVPATDPVFFPATATASNLIADATANGAGFAPGPTDVYAVLMDLGFNPQSGRTNQLNIIEAACQPGDACMGGNVTLCAQVSGTGPFTYQWMKNGAGIANATNQCLVVTNLLPAEAGQYCVRVTGACSTMVACLSLPACRPGAPAPRVAAVQFVPSAGAQLTIHGKPNRTYRVLCGTEVGNNWQIIGNVLTDANGLGEFMDETAMEAQCRIYRLQDPTAP